MQREVIALRLGVRHSSRIPSTLHVTRVSVLNLYEDLAITPAGRYRRLWYAYRGMVHRCPLQEGLQQHETNLIWLRGCATPVEEIVLESTVADAKLQLPEESLVVQDVQRIEHIEVQPLRENERIVN